MYYKAVREGIEDKLKQLKGFPSHKKAYAIYTYLPNVFMYADVYRTFQRPYGSMNFILSEECDLQSTIDSV